MATMVTSEAADKLASGLAKVVNLKVYESPTVKVYGGNESGYDTVLAACEGEKRRCGCVVASDVSMGWFVDVDTVHVASTVALAVIDAKTLSWLSVLNLMALPFIATSGTPDWRAVTLTVLVAERVRSALDTVTTKEYCWPAAMALAARVSVEDFCLVS